LSPSQNTKVELESESRQNTKVIRALVRVRILVTQAEGDMPA
jgi:hypothetical protein